MLALGALATTTHGTAFFTQAGVDDGGVFELATRAEHVFNIAENADSSPREASYGSLTENLAFRTGKIDDGRWRILRESS